MKNKKNKLSSFIYHIYSQHPAPKLSPHAGAELGNRDAESCRLEVQP